MVLAPVPGINPLAATHVPPPSAEPGTDPHGFRPGWHTATPPRPREGPLPSVYPPRAPDGPRREAAESGHLVGWWPTRRGRKGMTQVPDTVCAQRGAASPSCFLFLVRSAPLLDRWVKRLERRRSGSEGKQQQQARDERENAAGRLYTLRRDGGMGCL